MFAVRYCNYNLAYYYDSKIADWTKNSAELFETEEEAKKVLNSFVSTIFSDQEDMQEWDKTVFEIVNLDISPSKRFKLELKDPLTPIN